MHCNLNYLHFFYKKIICQEGVKPESTNSDVEENACIFCMPCAVHALRRSHTLGKDGAFAELSVVSVPC